MNTENSTNLETDPRFPSGKWLGFWLQTYFPGRQYMELHLSFRQGQITGEGRDRVGKFIFQGKYTVEDGCCHWSKRYLGKHDVFYKGYNEGKGIWGVWEMDPELAPAGHRGGFHIWPEGMADPTKPRISEEADVPIEVGTEFAASV